MWGKILTCDQLQNRGLSLASCCPLCLESGELVDHLLLHCSKTRVLWDLLFSLFEVPWILAAIVKDFLLEWKGNFLPKEKRGVWNAGPFCIFWIVWKTRNDIVFRDEVLSMQRL